MNVKFPRFSGKGDPRSTLVHFMWAVHKFLDELVRSNRDPTGRPLFWKQLLKPMRDAWREAEQNHYFSDVESRIRKLTSEKWREHGLYGRQLAFKLAVIRFFLTRYQSIGKSILRKLLNIIDDLLKSILEAVGGGGAISELKDFIKDSIEYETPIE